jgi:hypothetical protein
MNGSKSKISRRTVLAAGGTIGAIAAVVTLLPETVPETAIPAQGTEPLAKGGGYQLTEHVKRYYRTALV